MPLEFQLDQDKVLSQVREIIAGSEIRSQVLRLKQREANHEFAVAGAEVLKKKIIETYLRPQVKNLGREFLVAIIEWAEHKKLDRVNLTSDRLLEVQYRDSHLVITRGATGREILFDLAAQTLLSLLLPKA